MAPSFSNAKIFSSFFLRGFSNSLTRRGYAVASQNPTKGGVVSISTKIAPTSGEDKGVPPCKVSWVPDPVSGYYKPDNINEVDVADLRARLLAKNFNNSSQPIN